MRPSDWMNEQSGPYQLTTPTAYVTCYSRQAVYDLLDTMTPDERLATKVKVGWREEDGQYVHEALGFEATDAAQDGPEGER